MNYYPKRFRQSGAFARLHEVFVGPFQRTDDELDQEDRQQKGRHEKHSIASRVETLAM